MALVAIIVFYAIIFVLIFHPFKGCFPNEDWETKEKARAEFLREVAKNGG